MSLPFRVHVVELTPLPDRKPLIWDLLPFFEDTPYLKLEPAGSIERPQPMLEQEEFEAIRDWDTMDPPDDPPPKKLPKIWFQKRIPEPYTLEQIYEIGRSQADAVGPGVPVLVLVQNTNYENWFSHVDRERGMGFVKVLGWELEIRREWKAAIAIEMCKVMLHLAIVQMDSQARIEHHLRPTGCLFDHSIVKKDIFAKIRGADLCDRCMETAVESGANPLLLSSVFGLTQRLRERIVRQKSFIPRMNLQVCIEPDCFYFSSLQVEFKPDPAEYALYRLLVAHPEGIARADLDTYRRQLELYYPPTRLRDAPKVRRTLDLLCDLSDNSFNEKISRLNRKLRALLLEISEPFLVVKKNDVYVIPVNRVVFQVEESWRRVQRPLGHRRG